MKNAVIFEKSIMIVFGVLIVIGLYCSSLYNYLLFHTLVELFSVTVAFGLFMIAWNSRQFTENNYFVFLGIAYAFIGSVDLVHTLTYKGMPIFSGYDANLPTQFWIVARYLESISLLVAPYFIQRTLKYHIVLFTYVVAFSVGLITTFARVFPACYLEGVG